MKVYLVGSLRNPEVPKLAKRLREEGWEVFDDWMAAGPEADDHWQQYEKDRGHSFAQALKGFAAQHVFKYDRSHLDRCDAGVLLLPAGKSGHLEAGYLIGQGKPVWVLMPGEPERFDVMYGFMSGVFTNEVELLSEMKKADPRLTPGALLQLELWPPPTDYNIPWGDLRYTVTMDTAFPKETP